MVVFVSRVRTELASADEVVFFVSLKMTLEAPKFGIKGTGWVIPTAPPEALPEASEYAIAASKLMPMNCAFALVARKVSPKIKQAEIHSLRKYFDLFNICDRACV